MANDLLEAALYYAGRGWHVFPVHRADSGRCSCGRPCGKSAGKHPRTRHGHKDASTDPRQILAWWAKWPDANIGIATGHVSGIYVLDVDGDEGFATLRAMVEENVPLKWTPMVRTSRGFHLYYRLLDPDPIDCSTGNGLDIRADGGYVIAPPSVHPTGFVYAWTPESLRARWINVH